MKYIVQPWETWETMNSLASRYGVTVDELRRANPILNSINLYPGMILTIPGRQAVTLPSEGYIEYVVQPGDTLFNLAKKYRLDYGRVIAQNPQLINPNRIYPGEIIYLIYLGY
ncbi:LysM peptidoglycan-binding domain-containing protein [Sinanaerobacter chloroacetimidivorans]|jgi:LysM repeat protein|uniref:LysM peptidoglycan-binding domain-containing protein n=1 Tax=Sinanaerobacter chloroacetimidivorans TaxID=2818044 RepID=A0A8J8B0V8_9FIRM|nr:LysM peptidoglycan-binding domain-containing protein [Sinanaerobacter chloroacetimidivorans]MBR0597026.1 LysM peptidoglycan-binding domain-containing protein [Sinanaerobacter chloroacetimidivorans]